MYSVVPVHASTTFIFVRRDHNSNPHTVSDNVVLLGESSKLTVMSEVWPKVGIHKEATPPSAPGGVTPGRKDPQPMAWNRVASSPASTQLPKQLPSGGTSAPRKALGASTAKAGANVTFNAKKKKQTPRQESKGNSPPSSKKRKPSSGGIVTPKNAFDQKNPSLLTKQGSKLITPDYSKKPLAQSSSFSMQVEDFPFLSAAAPPFLPQKSKSKPAPVAAKTTLDDKKSRQKDPQKSAPRQKKKAPTAANNETTGATTFSKNHKQHNAFLSPPTAADSTRDMAGEEHALLRLMQQGKMIGKPTTKGRQRIRPRKKKFSPLKKKILEERLRKWRELHPEPDLEATTVSGRSSTVVLYGFVEPDEVEDDDEFGEIESNLWELALKVGKVRGIFIPRSAENGASGSQVPAFVRFMDLDLAKAAVECWNDLVLGGAKLRASVLEVGSPEMLPEKTEEWKSWCLEMEKNEVTSSDNTEQAVVAEIILENALTEDDLDDCECMEESLADVRTLASKLGDLESLYVEREPTPCVCLCYKCDRRQAREIVNKLNEVVIGGTKLLATTKGEKPNPTVDASSRRTVILSNLVTEDDIDDADCLEESLHDLRELAEAYGGVERVSAEIESGKVEVVFSAREDAVLAHAAFNGMVIGGTSVTASLLTEHESILTPVAPTLDKNVVESAGVPVALFSGDKRIPERFAECKRVPKIAGSGEPRNYAILSKDETVKPLLSEMLAELMRLQRRAIQDKNAKARRRLVMGLREVARGIRSHKVKMVVMANNLDEYGAIDAKLQEIIDLSENEDVPVFFEFSKRALGKAIGKSIKVAVVGIQNAEGAHQQFKKLATRVPRPLTAG